MEELKRLRSSRRGYRSHLSKTLASIAEVLEGDPAAPLKELDAILLANTLEQLQRKKEILRDLDKKIAACITEEGELETEIYEAEEQETSLLDKIAKIKFFLRPRRSPTGTSAEPPSNPSLRLERPADHPADHEPTNSIPPTSNRESTQENVNSESPNQPITLEASHGVTQPIPDPVSVHAPVTTSNPTTVSSTTPSSSSHNVSRLPKLNIPVYTGDPLLWQSFWDCFDAAINSNPMLTGVQKLSYLRAQLQGDAARVIAGFPLTDGNYSHSVALLQNRFGQSYKLVSAHMQALLDLPSPTNTLTSLQQFHDSVESHIRSLSSLGKDSESYGDLLVPIIIGKLPVETRKNLARDHSNSEWSLNELQDAILKEIRIFETGLHIVNQNSLIPTASFHTNAVRNPRPTHNSSDGKKKHPCVYCSGSHAPSICDVVTDYQKRLEIVKQGKLCFNCLAHHKISQCNSKHRCRRCKQKHHTSLCNSTDSDNKDAQEPHNTTTLTTISSTPQGLSLHLAGDSVCLLKTAVAPVSSSKVQIEANILFDEGSQRSFISQNLANSLQLHSHKKEDICLSSFGSQTPTIKQLQTGQIYLLTKTGERIPLSVLIVPNIATPLQNTMQTQITQLPHLQGICLAHPVIGSATSFEISLLIGADHYWDIVEDHIIRGNGPTAMKSKVGYLLSGPLSQSKTPTANVLNITIYTQHIEIEDGDLQKFWAIESTGMSSLTVNESDKEFFQSYIKSSIRRQPDGSYMARFPWKVSHPPLPTNRKTCEKRTRSLAYRLAQTPNLLQTYNNIFIDQEKRGFIERVTSPKISDSCHYIPHHAVRKDSSTTPLRIVYDCSCHQSKESPSLNDCLMIGPPFLNDLCSIILRFRTHALGISTDIEKAFLHVQLHEDDRDFTRFLWLSDPTNPNSDFQVYRFKVVLFGATSSTFMLNATLHHHLQQHDSPIAADMLTNLYVDNVISGCNSPDQAIQYYHKARSIMMDANFNLRAWASNCPQLNALAKQDKVANDNTTVNILGLQWNTITDTLSFTPKTIIPDNSALITKREVLQQSSKIFDPLGFLSPVTIQAKLLMQTLWQKHVDWDEPLEKDLQDEWHTIAKDIQDATMMTIPRRYFTTEDVSPQLHVFADASTKAYGAVAYLQVNSHTSFVMAKTRVAPLKTLLCQN